MFFFYLLANCISFCEMSPHILCLVSTELFIFAFLIDESYTLKTLGSFLGKKRGGGREGEM